MSLLYNGGLLSFMFTSRRMLQGSAEKIDKMGSGDGGPQFAEVFVIYWVGAAVVTLNTKLLGGNM